MIKFNFDWDEFLEEIPWIKLNIFQKIILSVILAMFMAFPNFKYPIEAIGPVALVYFAICLEIIVYKGLKS